MSYLMIGRGVDARLDKMENELARLRVKAREKGERLAALRAEVAELEEEVIAGAEQDALTDAAGQPVDSDRGKLHAKLAAASLKPAQAERERLGLERAIRKKEDEVSAFVSANIGELLAAHAPQVRDAAQELRKRISETRQAVETLTALEQRSARLLGPIDGIDGRDVPPAGIDGLRRALDETKIVLPLPRSLSPPMGAV